MRSNIVYDGAADIFAEYNYAMVYAYKINDDDYLARSSCAYSTTSSRK